MKKFKEFDGDFWRNAQEIKSKEFVCYNCGNKVASNRGFGMIRFDSFYSYIYICPHCLAPNVFDYHGDRPELMPYGEFIKKIPEEISNVYEEIRLCMAVGAYTAAAMLMRKILMNFAVLEGAREDGKFQYYVNFLCEKGFVHMRNRKLADKIRDLGNEANHELAPISAGDAKSLFQFLVHFLKSNYEFADEEESKKS